ncbi:MAG: Uncharacterised protein [Cellulomonadaceae bacterium TMED98]|nr:MAG: Uncharacterised protein [Cellulomonadaceae bacterium TMED98]
MLGQQDIPGNNRFFGDCRPAGQTQPRRQGPLIHLSPVGETRFLGVLGDDSVKRAHVFQCSAHHLRIRHAVTVIGKHPHLRVATGHTRNARELFAGKAFGDRTNWLDGDVACFLT